MVSIPSATKIFTGLPSDRKLSMWFWLASCFLLLQTWILWQVFPSFAILRDNSKNGCLLRDSPCFCIHSALLAHISRYAAEKKKKHAPDTEVVFFLSLHDEH